MDGDLDPKQWDIRGLARWGESRFGCKLSQNQLRNMSVDDVQASFLESAEAKFAGIDLAPIDRFLDEFYGTKSIVEWARQKFGIPLEYETFRDLSNETIVAKLREAIRLAYREREVRYPVEWILERTILAEQADSAYAADLLVKWANLKFALGWTVDDVRNRPADEIAEQLIALNRDYTTNGRLVSEIDRAESTDGDLAAWGRARFGPAFDDEVFAAAAEPREALLTFGHDLLRRELTMLERFVLLQIYDQAWKDHMHAIDLLKDSIGLRGYAEQDPKIAYKREASQMFNEMMDGIHERVTGIIFRARLTDEATARRSRYNIGAVRHADATNLGFTAGGADRDRAAAMQAQGAEQKVETIRREEPRVGRNDPCPCGSGKKYKVCHGRGK